MAEIGTVIEGKYEILREIGKGGMSVVYLAMDTHLNKQWAVKEIRKRGSGKNDEIVVNSLLAEANLMKRLDHPALPRIVDIIDNGVTIFVVMDYIEGESLDKILKEYGPQPEEKVIAWAKQLCDALSYLHRYTSAMSELLNGSEYNNASNGLSAAIERINAQIRSLSGKVQSNYNAINQYNRNVDYWNRKLSDLRKKNKVKKK